MTSQIGEAELTELLAPLTAACQRGQVALIDPAGRKRLAGHDPEHIARGVRHVIQLLRSQPNIRSPFGLLIDKLDQGNIPAETQTRTQPTPTAVAEHTVEDGTDPQLWALAETMSADTSFWETHIAPLLAGAARRCPDQPKARTARIYGELINHPELIQTAQQHANQAAA